MRMKNDEEEEFGSTAMFVSIRCSLPTVLSRLVILRICPVSMRSYAGKTSASFTQADSHLSMGQWFVY